MRVEQSEALLGSKYGINFLLGKKKKHWSKELHTHNKTGDGRFRFGKSMTAGINILIQVIGKIVMNDILKIFRKN